MSVAPLTFSITTIGIRSAVEGTIDQMLLGGMQTTPELIVMLTITEIVITLEKVSTEEATITSVELVILEVDVQM